MPNFAKKWTIQLPLPVIEILEVVFPNFGLIQNPSKEKNRSSCVPILTGALKLLTRLILSDKINRIRVHRRKMPIMQFFV